MRKIIPLFLVFLLFFLCSPSFAFTRGELIDRTLVETETMMALESKLGDQQPELVAFSGSQWSEEMQNQVYSQPTVHPADQMLAEEAIAPQTPKSTQEAIYQSRLPEKESFTEKYSASEKKVFAADTEKEEKKNNFYVSLAYDANYMNYKEVDSADNKLDEDYGYLRGVSGIIGYRSDRPLEFLGGKPFVEGYYRNYDEIITYDGATTAGAPFVFDEKQDVERYGIKLGSYKEMWDRGEIFGYLDLGKRIWHRGENEIIRGVITYAEKYYWTYVGIGGGVNYQLTPRFSVGVDLEGIPVANSPEMRADLYEGATFKLSAVRGFSIRAPLKYYLMRNFSLDLTPYLDYWEIEKSDPEIISGKAYYEPDSQTYVKGILLGFSYKF